MHNLSEQVSFSLHAIIHAYAAALHYVALPVLKMGQVGIAYVVPVYP